MRRLYPLFDPPNRHHLLARFWGMSVIGAVLAMMIAAQAASFADDYADRGYAFVATLIVLAGAALQGLIVAIAQWTVLGEYVRDEVVPRWLFATSAGAVCGWGAALIIARFALDGLALELAQSEQMAFAVLLLLGFLAGSIIGAAQWAVLGDLFAGGARWIIANGLSMSAAAIVVRAASGDAGEREDIASSLTIVGVALLAAVIGSGFLAFAAASIVKRPFVRM